MTFFESNCECPTSNHGCGHRRNLVEQAIHGAVVGQESIVELKGAENNGCSDNSQNLVGKISAPSVIGETILHRITPEACAMFAEQNMRKRKYSESNDTSNYNSQEAITEYRNQENTTELEHNESNELLEVMGFGCFGANGRW